MEITMKRTRMELVKHYWKCEYEWNACPLEPWGDVIDVHHGDSLAELFIGENPEQIKNKVKNGLLEIRLQRWKWSVCQYGIENGDQDFDYAYINENWKLDEESSHFGKHIPKRFQKELDRFLGGE